MGLSQTASTVLGNAIGNGVGNFVGDIAGQAYFNGSVDMNQAGKGALYGFGGGLGAGLVDISPLSKMDFPMHHTVKHLARSTAYEMSGNLFSGDPVFENLSYGMNLGMIVPLAFDFSSIATSILTRKNKLHVAIDYGIGELEENTQEITSKPIAGADGWYLKDSPTPYSGLGLRDPYNLSQASSKSLQPIYFIGSPQNYVFYNTIGKNGQSDPSWPILIDHPKASLI